MKLFDKVCKIVILRLDTHLTSVKCDCNGYAVVTRAGEPEPERGAMEPANFGGAGAGAGATKILLAPAPVMVHRINFIE